MTQKTRYDRESLLAQNALYDQEHGLTQEDADKANCWIRHIECSRDALSPQVGDQVRYTTREGDFYSDALVESIHEDGTLSICLCPFVPFVQKQPNGISCTAGGGPFTNAPGQALKAVGTTLGTFKDWGHCGPCAHGAFYFSAEVRLWEYREPEPLYKDFSTEKWRKVCLYKDRKSLNSSLYSGACISFETEKEFQQFLRDYEGTVFSQLNPQRLIVWCYRDITFAVTQLQWDALDAPITQRRIYNDFQPVKLIKDHVQHTTGCYYVLPVFQIH